MPEQNEGYQPSEEEVQKSEAMMTDIQKKMTKEREGKLQEMTWLSSAIQLRLNHWGEGEGIILDRKGNPTAIYVENGGPKGHFVDHLDWSYEKIIDELEEKIYIERNKVKQLKAEINKIKQNGENNEKTAQELEPKEDQIKIINKVIEDAKWYIDFTKAKIETRDRNYSG